MSKAERDLLYKTIDDKQIEFIKTYRKPPRYIKIPLWIFEALKTETLKIEYLTGKIQLCNMYVCETETIAKIEEIEVF